MAGVCRTSCPLPRGQGRRRTRSTQCPRRAALIGHYHAVDVFAPSHDQLALVAAQRVANPGLCARPTPPLARHRPPMCDRQVHIGPGGAAVIRSPRKGLGTNYRRDLPPFQQGDSVLRAPKLNAVDRHEGEDRDGRERRRHRNPQCDRRDRDHETAPTRTTNGTAAFRRTGMPRELSGAREPAGFHKAPPRIA